MKPIQLIIGLLILFGGIFSNDLNAQSEGAKIHTVSSGETLYKIARRYGLELSELRALNLGLKGDKIFPGDKLIVSRVEEKAEPLANSVSGLPRRSAEGDTDWEDTHLNMLFEDGRVDYEKYEVYEFSQDGASQKERDIMPRGEKKYIYHTVAEGEDIYSIAKKYKIDPQEIINYNGSAKVVAGDKLFIPLQMGSDSRSISEEKESRKQTEQSYSNARRHQSILIDSSVKSEQGFYETVRINGVNEIYYALHPTLPRGTLIKIQIPGNAGYLEAKVIGRFSTSSGQILGLSPQIDDILSLTGKNPRITIYY